MGEKWPKHCMHKWIKEKKRKLIYNWRSNHNEDREFILMSDKIKFKKKNEHQRVVFQSPYQDYKTISNEKNPRKKDL
jgi:hypothetical protein